MYPTIVPVTKAKVSPSTRPINVRKAARNCAKYLDEELHSLKFEMAIFMGKTTFKLVKGLLKLDFPYRVVPLPFRSVTSFKKELEKALQLYQ